MNLGLAHGVRQELLVRRVLAADAMAPSIVRRMFRDWFRELEWPGDDADDLLLAVSEAVSNVTDHAYPEGVAGRVVVRGRCLPAGTGQRQLVITVRDNGSWRPSPEWHENRRRGLPLMRACTASLNVRGTPNGTRVRMISRPAPNP